MTDAHAAVPSSVEPLERPEPRVGAPAACVLCGLLTMHARDGHITAGLRMNGRPMGLVVSLHTVNGAELVPAVTCPGCMRNALRAWQAALSVRP